MTEAKPPALDLTLAGEALMKTHRPLRKWAVRSPSCTPATWSCSLRRDGSC